MKRALGIFLILMTPLLAGAQFSLPHSVFGNGGGGGGGAAFQLRGTLGQTLVGVVAGVEHSNEIGFWYQPLWEPTALDEVPLPLVYGLDQNFPNPFNPKTCIRYALPEATHVRLRIYDARGRALRVLIDEEKAAGWHDLELRAEGMASGVYFYRIDAGDFNSTRKLVVIK